MGAGRWGVRWEEAEEIRAEGGRPYVDPGERIERGRRARCSFECAVELADQIEHGAPRFDTVVITAFTAAARPGSSGRAARRAPREIVGVPMAWPADRVHEYVARTVAEAIRRFGLAIDVPKRIHLLDGYQGSGRRGVAEDELRTIVRLAQQEGVVLDPVYTGKAFWPPRHAPPRRACPRVPDLLRSHRRDLQPLRVRRAPHSPARRHDLTGPLSAAAGVSGADPRHAEIRLTGGDLDGLDIHYVEAGHGPVTVLIHGLGGFAETWRVPPAPWRAAAASSHSTCLDSALRRSPAVTIAWRPRPVRVRAARQVRDSRVRLAGHSLGGAVAVACAALFPDRVERLALLGACIPGFAFRPSLSFRLVALPGLGRSSRASVTPGLCRASVARCLVRPDPEEVTSS